MNSRIHRKISRIRSIISLVATARDVFTIEYTYLIRILNNQKKPIKSQIVIKSCMIRIIIKPPIIYNLS